MFWISLKKGENSTNKIKSNIDLEKILSRHKFLNIVIYLW